MRTQKLSKLWLLLSILALGLSIFSLQQAIHNGDRFKGFDKILAEYNNYIQDGGCSLLDKNGEMYSWTCDNKTQEDYVNNKTHFKNWSIVVNNGTQGIKIMSPKGKVIEYVTAQNTSINNYIGIINITTSWRTIPHNEQILNKYYSLLGIESWDGEEWAEPTCLNNTNFCEKEIPDGWGLNRNTFRRFGNPYEESSDEDFNKKPYIIDAFRMKIQLTKQADGNLTLCQFSIPHPNWVRCF